MTASVVVVAVGAVAAAIGTGVLTARCAGTPRSFLIAWTVAVFALAIALGAQTLGYLSGYTPLMFRCMEIGAQALAPLALCLGLVELIGQSVPARFLMRLAVSAIGVVVLVILGTDPLGTTALSTSWPDPTAFYQQIPIGLIKFLAVFTILTALVSGLVVLARSGRGREFGAVVGPGLTAATAAALVAVTGLMMLANVRLHSSLFALTGVIAAGLTWLAASVAGRRDLVAGRLADQPDGGGQYVGPGWYEADDEHDYPHDDLGRLDPRDDPRPRYQDEDLYRDRWPAQATQRLSDSDDDLRYPALAALAAERSDPQENVYDPVSRPRPDPRGGRGPADDGIDAGDHFFGQITIYTLLDDRVEEFDRMTELVVRQVRSREPGTLVYIVHAVPTAPMQRILYEVYRDRAAYDEHLAQPYVSRYAAERRSMVLAANAIELGLQQAKVTPLPSYSAISDILSESGIDLTGVTRPPGGAARDARDARDARAGQRRSGPPGPLEPRAGRYLEPLSNPHPGSHRYEPPRQDRAYEDRAYEDRAYEDRAYEDGAYGDSARHDSDEPGYQDWAGLRGEEPWYG